MPANQRNPARPRVTQLDVARRARVSQATVSIVLAGRSDSTVNVGVETRQRVTTAAEELGYVPNVAARSLAGGRTGLVGVFTFEPIFPADNRDFYQPFLLGIEQEAEQRDLDLLLFTSMSGGRQIFLSGRNRMALVDGSVLLGRNEHKEELQRLVDEAFAFVYIGRRTLASGVLNYVAPDYASATAEMVSLAKRLGHERLRYVGLPLPAEPGQDREEGFRGSGEHDIVRITPEEITGRWVANAVESGVTAMFLEDETLREPLVNAMKSRRLEVPGDLSIVILDDESKAEALKGTAPTWTSIAIPRVELGRKALEILTAEIAGEPHPSAVLVACHLVIGKSLGPPRQRP